VKPLSHSFACTLFHGTGILYTIQGTFFYKCRVLPTLQVRYGRRIETTLLPGRAPPPVSPQIVFTHFYPLLPLPLHPFHPLLPLPLYLCTPVILYPATPFTSHPYLPTHPLLQTIYLSSLLPLSTSIPFTLYPTTPLPLYYPSPLPLYTFNAL
jgi:hypothetical protein